MDIFNQLGALFLAAIPTVIVVFLFYVFLRWSFFRPMERVLAERKARIEGARRDAEAIHSQAGEKDRAYRELLRKARAEVFSEQEAARRAALDERNAAIQQARSQANGEIHTAKGRIGREVEAARGELGPASDQLAEQIVRGILEREQLQPSPAGEVR